MTTIERLETKYLSLLEEIAVAEKAAAMLREILEAEGVEFDDDGEGTVEPAADKPARRSKKATAESNGSTGTTERIRDHLQANGPSRIKDIAAALSLGEPAVANCLKRYPETFKRTKPDNRLSPWICSKGAAS